MKNSISAENRAAAAQREDRTGASGIPGQQGGRAQGRQGADKIGDQGRGWKLRSSAKARSSLPWYAWTRWMLSAAGPLVFHRTVASSEQGPSEAV